MKSKIAFALVMASAGGAWSCLSQGQDPVGQLRALRSSAARTLYGQTAAGADLAIGQGSISLADEEINPDEKVAGLARQIKSVEGAEREGLVAKLKSSVGEQFDQRQFGKARELKALEEQLAKLKEIHNKRTQQRDQIVADRVQQIMREVEGLGWGTDSTDSPRLRSTRSSDRIFVAPAVSADNSPAGFPGYAIPYTQPAIALPSNR